jgi:MHS family proline/betaine transporter-like MFS transporter
VGYNIGVMVAGGTAPLISATLARELGNPLAPAFFVLGVAFLGLFTMLFTPRTAVVEHQTTSVAAPFDTHSGR